MPAGERLRLNGYMPKSWAVSRNFYLWRNNDEVDSIETGHIVTAYSLRWSDQENCMYTALF